MDTNEPQKLILLPERIIHILLKHLMLLKNENVFLNNYIGIKSIENPIPENRNGPIYSLGGIPEKRNGTNDVIGSIPENEKGINPILDALPELSTDDNSNNLLYSVFEQELLSALQQYIKEGNGQNTLYSFYENFLNAISEKNSIAEKLKLAEANLSLEDTHTLPSQITIDNGSISKVRIALREHLPRVSRRDFQRTVARELLFLFNAQKATGAQLRTASGLSKAGYAKHQPLLKKYGFVVYQSPSNYVLTEKSKHLLLKLFGVPKNNNERIQ